MSPLTALLLLVGSYVVEGVFWAFDIKGWAP